MAILQAVLFFMHPVLDRMLVPTDERIINHPRFYRLHGLYLDLSAAHVVVDSLDRVSLDEALRRSAGRLSSEEPRSRG